MVDLKHATAEAIGLDGAIGRRQPPGRLHGDIALTVQSRSAQRAIVGRRATTDKPLIVGLLGFADRLRVIWQAAADDDPYADWWLIKVDLALDYAGIVIDDEVERLRRLVQSTALEIGISTSTRPYRLSLKFATPYAYRGAQLIAAFDQAACTAVTAQYTGLLPKADAERRVERCAALLRSLFGVSQAYRLLHIDRATVAAGGPVARRAAELMGELPKAVMSGDQVAPWHPGRSKPAGVVEVPATPMPAEDGR
jgi:integrating conjugative element protein (TIGR03761 family)